MNRAPFGFYDVLAIALAVFSLVCLAVMGGE